MIDFGGGVENSLRNKETDTVFIQRKYYCSVGGSDGFHLGVKIE